MLSVFAEAQVRKVPVVKKSKVIVLSDGAEVSAGLSMAGTGYMLYAAVVVSTIRNVSRGFDRER
jgi:molybdopterin biosynthesis enzyme